jgi:hypothetical protein
MHEHTTELITNLLLPSFFDLDGIAKSKNRRKNRKKKKKNGNDTLLPSCGDGNDVQYDNTLVPMYSIDIIDGDDYDTCDETVNRLKSTMREHDVQQLVLSEIRLDTPVVQTLIELLKTRCSSRINIDNDDDYDEKEEEDENNPWDGVYLQFCEGLLGSAIEQILLQVDCIHKLEIACGMNVQRECVQALSHGLGRNRSLKELSLFMTLDEDATNQLIVGLSENITLSCLRFIRCTIRLESIAPMAVFLKSDKRLQVLGFDQCTFQDHAGLGKILHSLVRHPSLKELHVCGAIFDDGKQALSELLTYNSLTKLYLQNRTATTTPSNTPKLKDTHYDGLNWLTVSLVRNRSLKTLDLSYLGVDDRTLKGLFCAICVDGNGCFNSLEEIRLHENHIGNDGATLFASGMHKMSPNLKKIFLHRNRFDEIGAKALLDGIRNSCTDIRELTIPSMGRSKAMTEYQRLINFETMLNSGGRQLLRNIDAKDSNRALPSGLWPAVLERSGEQLWTPYSEFQMKTLNNWRSMQQADLLFYLIRGAVGRAILGNSPDMTTIT